jgi:hypothetical protein
MIAVQPLGTAWRYLLQGSNTQWLNNILPPHCPTTSDTKHPLTPRNIPEQLKPQLHRRFRLCLRQDILMTKGPGSSAKLVLHDTISQPKRPPPCKYEISYAAREWVRRRECSENERWEFLTSHVCRHFSKHICYVKPVYWRTCNIHTDLHEPFKIKSMKRHHIKTSKVVRYVQQF